MHCRHLIGIAFILLQIFSIAYSRFVPERFFCWAPYDEHTFYEITVEVDGYKLTQSEITSRYRYSARNWEVRSIHNVISQVRQYESTYGRNDKVIVTIEFSANGHPKEVWTWPEA